MDHTSSQHPMSGLHRPSIPANSLPPEYWNLDPLYPGPDPQQQLQQPQQQSNTSQQPEGIDWNHPVFNQQPQPQPQRNQIPQEHNHGIYSSSTPQSWQPNSLRHPSLMPSTQQGLGVPRQYPQVHQFPQSQLAFDSRSPLPSDSAPFPSLPLSQDFFPPQHYSLPETFPQQPSQQTAASQNTQTAPYQSNTHQTSMNQYSIPAGFSEDTSHAHTPITYSNGFPDPPPSQQTINPQFLNTTQQSANQQNALLNNNFLYLSPADFERPDNSKPFNFYRNDLQMPSSLNPSVINNQSIPARNSSNVQVVINGQGPTLAPKDVKTPGPQRKTGAQKAAKSQTKSGKQTGGQSSSSSDSDDSIEIHVPSPEEPSPIPSQRPSEPLAAARYDTLHAVWSPRNRRPNADKVKNAIVAFKNVVKAVRDTWKDNTQEMKAAENKGETDKEAHHKKDVVLQRRLMDVVVSTTLEMGHPTIVEKIQKRIESLSPCNLPIVDTQHASYKLAIKLGEHPIAVAAMYSFLLDRHQAADIDGALTVNLLKLLSHFTTLDEEVLQKTNVAKLLPRFLKKGGQTVKDLAKKIQDNAVSSSKRKQGSKEGSPGKSPAPDATATNGPRTEAAGSKRPREGESNGQPSKRVVVNSNTKNPSKPGPTGNGASAKRPQEAGQDPKAGPAIAARPKANIVAPKPTNLFGSLGSASKRPGTSNAERAAAAAAAKPSAPEKKKEAASPAPKPTFSFGDIMADLNKQKDPGPAKPVEDGPPETEEERQKRLRKEARRRLRVSWKPEHSLTEVRFFTHDPEEELGPGDRPQRLAGDVKGEGRILKLHKDVDELGEEDEGGIREENFGPYYEPLGMRSSRPKKVYLTLTGSVVDDTGITLDERDRNYVKRCGTQQPTSPEKQAQEHREATTLMVFHTSLADVPPTPKEPPPPDEDEIVPDVLSFGALPDFVKVRQERYFSYINPKPTTPPAGQAPNNQFDISNLLKIIQAASQQQQKQQPPTQPVPPPQPVSQAPSSDLERTINMFRQQQQPQPQAPPQVPQMPQFPVPQPPSGGQGVDFQKLLSVMNAQNQAQQPPPPVFPQAPQSQPGIAPNLAAIISQFSNKNQQNGSNMSSQVYEDPERKRMRETGFDGAGDENSNQTKRNRFNAPNKKHPKVGIVPCRYWREGKCLKGDDCTFRHDPLS